jgi:hypothetical protein
LVLKIKNKTRFKKTKKYYLTILQSYKLMTESKLQQEIFNFYQNNYCLKFHNPRGMIFSIPNGGTRNKLEAITMKATGLLAGASDLIVILPNGKLMFIELKTDTGKQSDKQIDFEKRVNDLGFEYRIIRSLEEFKQLIWTQ